MTKARNIEASVRQRLLNLAKSRQEEFGLILTRYAIERLLHRISIERDIERLQNQLDSTERCQ